MGKALIPLEVQALVDASHSRNQDLKSLNKGNSSKHFESGSTLNDSQEDHSRHLFTQGKYSAIYSCISIDIID